MTKSKKQELGSVSIVDKLVTRFRDAIVSGQMEPGSHIGVKKLADEYGVSMIPVREALARLLSSRLVRVELNRGYFVANRPTEEEFSCLVKARVIIETSALADGFSKITKADISALVALNDKMRKLAEQQHQKKNVLVNWLNLNGQFHKTLVGTSHNPFLNSIHEGLSLEASMARPFAEALPPLSRFVEDHDRIIQAMNDGDQAMATSALSEHISSLILPGEGHRE